MEHQVNARAQGRKGVFSGAFVFFVSRCEASYLLTQISEISGRESGADFCHIEHKERKDAANLRIFCRCFVFYAFLVVNRPPNSELLRPNFAS